jgi:hypothetical protein
MTLIFALVNSDRLKGLAFYFDDDCFGLRARQYSSTEGLTVYLCQRASSSSRTKPRVSSSCTRRPARRACSFLHLFYPGFLDGVFSEAYERVIMETILVAKVIDSVGPLSMYLATMFYRTGQTKVAEGLLLGE